QSADATSGLDADQPNCTLDGAAADCGNLRTAAAGTHEVTAQAVDAAGNTAQAHLTLHVDSAAPTVSLSTACATPGSTGWCRAASFSFTASAADATSGLDAGSPSCAVDGQASACAGSVTGSGLHTVSVTARDAAGN